MNYLNEIRRLRKKYEEKHRRNRAVFLPEGFLTDDAFYEDKNLRVEKICTRYHVSEKSIVWNSVKSALRGIGEKDTKLGFPYKNIFSGRCQNPCLSSQV